jgi:hypothetical protein
LYKAYGPTDSTEFSEVFEPYSNVQMQEEEEVGEEEEKIYI